MTDVNSAYSQNKTIDAKVFVEQTADKIKNGIKSISDAASAGASKAVQKVKSAFKSTDFPKTAGSPKKQDKPEESRKQKQGSPDVLVYPANLSYFAKFSFKEYNRSLPLKAATDKPTATIILPLPANLSEQFGVEYDTPALGPVLGSVAGSLLPGQRGAETGGASVIAEKEKELGASVAAAGGAVALKIAKSVAEAQLGPEAGAATSALITMATGVAPNPHLAVVFKNIGLREHSFSYKFAPNSFDELQTIKKIIKSMKKSMLPGFAKGQDILYSFPDVCDIEFTFGNNTTPPLVIKRCVMTNMSVNYAPNGPAFFRTGDPVIVEISLSFKEMSAFTRRDIGE